MPSSDFHLDRARAESFGAIAQTYARLRPSPPPALIEDLLALDPRTVLDVGCGTGKAVLPGVEVLGVDVDPRMAALAPIPVEIARFEAWDDRGRHFDLLTCGDAWHWVDPRRGFEKAERVATHVVRFWSDHVYEDPASTAVHDRLEPGLRRVGQPPPHPHAPDPFASELRVYPWERSLRREDWLALVSTYSSHQQLGPVRLAALLDGLRAVLPDVLRLQGATDARFSRSRAAPR